MILASKSAVSPPVASSCQRLTFYKEGGHEKIKLLATQFTINGHGRKHSRGYDREGINFNLFSATCNRKKGTKLEL